jgi:hypothetical protein
MTPDRCEALQHWQHKTLGKFNIYAHPDVELSVVEANDQKPSMALIGYMIDPNCPDRTNVDILSDIHKSVDSVEGICKYLYNISGRFVLAVDYPKDAFVFHDACGLRSVFYTKRGENICIGSQPLIFKEIMPLRQGERFSSYDESEYRKSENEHWFPCGCSLFEQISQLVPNHYLRLSTLDQVRYWPNRRLQYEPLDRVSEKASQLLEGIMKAANERFSLALSLTAGFDSRTLLSASKAIAPDVYFYTLQYRKLTARSPDIAIPMKLLYSLGYKHHLIDCRKEIDPEFDRVYGLSTSMAHNYDWGNIAYGMMVGGYPLERVAVKGSCAEICRCAYYETGNHQPIESPSQIIELESGWSNIPFAREQIANWYERTKPVSEESGVDILDLFYWEQRNGSWQAQSQLEWDIVQEAFTPFNQRRLLETMLSTPSEYRCAPHYSLFRKICEALWPQVLSEPINPLVGKELVRAILFRIGLGEIARSIYKRFTRRRV